MTVLRAIPADPESIAAAAVLIRAGGLVAMPTETVYGLAANALDPVAVLRIFSAKGRPTFDPLIVHVADPDQAWTLAVPSERARMLARHHWPGPLTMVLPRRPGVPDAVTSGLDTVAIRCPDHLVARALIRMSGLPLAAPSANRFGRLSPTTADHVLEQLADAVDMVLDGGPCLIGIESTVLLPDPVPVILRPGGLTREALELTLGQPVGLGTPSLARASPGHLLSHYAPRKPLRIRDPGQAWSLDAGTAVLSWRGAGVPADGRPVEILSPMGDLVEAACGLFAALRRLDASSCGRIEAEWVPDQGLGLGINDRLRRAAGPRQGADGTGRGPADPGPGS